jgi:hypothetical protein
LNLNEIIKKIVKDFDKIPVSQEELDKILEQTPQGHQFILSLIYDKKNFERLKQGKIFDNHINADKRGWLYSHNFPITLEILNKEKVPGRSVVIPSMGGSKADLLVYYALCPELENFISLIVWLNSQSSKNAWDQILDLISQKTNSKVLQFSEKCGIELPNMIHPSGDRDSVLVEKTLYESVYDWKFCYYLFDDGKTIISHNSPINFRRVVLDEWTKEESFIEIRSTIGRINSIANNSIDVTVPCLFEIPKKRSWLILKKLDKSRLEKNNLYFFQLFKKTGIENIEIFVREFEKARPVDIVGMFLSQSLYLLHLDSSRLKIMNKKQFEKLFNYYYNQVSKFCFTNKEEISSMDRLDWFGVHFGYADSFTQWIGDELYFLPPLLRRYISHYNPEIRVEIIKKFDESLHNQNSECFDKIPFAKNGNRMFSTRQELAKLNGIYAFLHFLLKSKRFILKIGQNPLQIHQRDEEIKLLKNKIV